MSVLFVSNHGLKRDENLRAVWDAYDGPKEFLLGVSNVTAHRGHPVVVCDTLMPHDPQKDYISVNIGHGITGGKLYGLDEQRRGIDPRALAQTDYVISTGTAVRDIAAGSFGIPVERALPLGMPRTDWYVGRHKGDGGTLMAGYRRAYLYAPTFRGPNDGARLPSIDWSLIDRMLADDEVLVVKRHYFTRDGLVNRRCSHIVEVPHSEPSAGYLIDCDVLVTDYSSILFDAYVLGKPSVLLVDDADAYLQTRGMYFDYPTWYCSRSLRVERNEVEFLRTLRDAADDGMGEVERNCVGTVADMCDGGSSRRVADLIRSLA